MSVWLLSSRCFVHTFLISLNKHKASSSFILNSCKQIWGVEKAAHLWSAPGSTWPCYATGQDSKFSTGCGYPKTPFKREPDTDKDIQSEKLQSIFCWFRLCNKFWSLLTSCRKLYIAPSFLYYIRKHLFSFLCNASESVYVWLKTYFWIVFGYGWYNLNQTMIRVGCGYDFLQTG